MIGFAGRAFDAAPDCTGAYPPLIPAQAGIQNFRSVASGSPLSRGRAGMRRCDSRGMRFGSAPLAVAATTAVLLALDVTPAFAHLSPDEHGSFMAGFTHPLFGLDHILAMVAVGLWAAMLGGRAVWIVPSAFVGMMAVGFALAVGGIGLGLALGSGLGATTGRWATRALGGATALLGLGLMTGAM